MSTITVSLADEDLAFLRRFSQEQGTSTEEFLARQAKSLRTQFDRPLAAEIVAASGIIAVQAQPEEHLKHLEQKHR